MVAKLRFHGVTNERAERFAAAWLECSLASIDLSCESIEAAGVMEWPDDRAAQARFNAIADEIMEKTLAALLPRVAPAFRKAAREVLTRERRR